MASIAVTNRHERLADRARIAVLRNDLAEAEQLCRNVLARDPGHVDAMRTLGIVAVKTRRLDIARQVLPKAAALSPQDPEIHTYLGATWLLLGKPDDCLDTVDRALAMDATSTLAWNIRACALGSLNRHEESIDACNAALALQADYAAALVNRGNAQVQLGRTVEALASFEEACRCDPASADAANNCGNVLRSLKRFDEALKHYDRALALHPEFAQSAHNRGIALSELGRPREAIESYQRALAIDPSFLEARQNLAYCRLQIGDFTSGWIDYEAQSMRLQNARGGPRFDQPRWTGAEPVRGRTVLLHADAGLGDTIQFCRYAELLTSLGATVVLEVQPALAALMHELPGAAKVIPAGKRLPKFDLHCPIMDVPAAFQSDLHSIPAHVPYLRGSTRLSLSWADRLDARRPRIGLVWSGNPAHSNDHNRSLPLQTLLPLLDFEAQWVSLQKEVRQGDAQLLEQHGSIRHFGGELQSFADTAALIENLDLVIAVDTSIAHLAGAMGKPLWLLLPFNPDWRWLLHRNDSPWYPTARLFRQTSSGDWKPVVDRIGRSLRHRRFAPR